MAVHELKCWPPYFWGVVGGGKTFELRRDDRGFQPGDELELREWVPEPEHAGGGCYTGTRARAPVTYVLRAGGVPGLLPGYVVLGLGQATLLGPGPGGAEGGEHG